jgi:hypothetical protein
MGDRGNIVVRGHGSEVFLYTHWHGYDVPELARRALAKRWRWNDPQYLTRIVFDTMTEGQSGEETGFGITSVLCDNGHPLFIVDCDKQQVFLEGDGEAHHAPGPEAKPLTFEKFAALAEADFGTFDPAMKSEDEEDEEAA